MTRQEELREMVAAATPGPWDADGPAWNRIIWSPPENRVCFMAHSDGLNDDRDIATSKLVAQAPTLAMDLADALDQIERLKVALQPFADAAEEADEYGFDDENQAAVDCGMCREARAALQEAP